MCRKFVIFIMTSSVDVTCHLLSTRHTTSVTLFFALTIFSRFFKVLLPRISQRSSRTELSRKTMDNVRTKKRQWRPKRQDDNQPQGRRKIRLIRLEEPLKVVLKNESCQRQVIENQYRWSAPKPVTTPGGDRFHWSKPKTEENTTNKQSSNFQELSVKTKATVTQLAGFLKKPLTTEGTKIQMTKNPLCSPVKETPSAQDSVLCGTKHRTVIGTATEPSCLDVGKKSAAVFELEHDFDYSLDLMGEYTLREGDLSKKLTPFWFEADQTAFKTAEPVKPANLDTTWESDRGTSPNVSLDTTFLHPQQFIGEIDLGIALGKTPDDEEFDIVMNSGRGYTYINTSRHRGIKRRIAYDEEEEDHIPRKMLRTY